MRSNRRNRRVWTGGALLLGLAITMGETAGAAELPISHRVEIQDGTKTATIEQRFVKGTKGWDVYLIASGAVTGAKTAAIMRANGNLDIYNGAGDPAWWKSFFSANGLVVTAELTTRLSGAYKLANVTVHGTNANHRIGVAMIDPDNPWGPCPGPDDAPTCRPEPVIIVFPCLFDVDQCSGGPLAGPDVRGIDPDGDPAVAGQDPDGEPARGLGLVRLSLDAAVVSGNVRDLGKTVLPMRGTGRSWSYSGPAGL